ncbi:MAG: hypothetical protein MUE41_10545 [Gemmatimonadaceae bacterium]|nr:hypothetical protein [Gemmatimonadaceae bacterium]
MRGGRGATGVRRGGTDAMLAGLLPLLVVLVMGFVLLSGRSVTPSIVETADSLSVSSWGYARTLAYAAIDSVTLRRNLDGLGKRRDGMQSGNAYVGWFDLAPYGRTQLFVDAAKRPFVVVHPREGATVVLSAADSAAATALAMRLRERTGGGR